MNPCQSGHWDLVPAAVGTATAHRCCATHGVSQRKKHSWQMCVCQQSLCHDAEGEGMTAARVPGAEAVTLGGGRPQFPRLPHQHVLRRVVGGRGRGVQQAWGCGCHLHPQRVSR